MGRFDEEEEPASVPPPYTDDEFPAGAKPQRVNGEAHSAVDDDDVILPAEFSEDALAAEWVKRHSQDWRYVEKWACWYKWDGAQWREEERAFYFELARRITRQALEWPKVADLNANAKRKLNSASTAAAMLRFIKSDPTIAANTEQWDGGTLLLGVPGGVVDLTSCKLIPVDRTQYITKRTRVAPLPGKPEKWLQFLDRITGGDQDLVAYLQRFSGYCLTGETREHALAFLYGTGANGKTTFVETILNIIGDYGLTTGMETLAESQTERHSTEIARLRGARLVASEETKSGAKWNESRIKRLTGGGRIAARKMRQDDFEFTPAFKLLLAGNYKPALRADEAMKRRIHLVPFTVTIPPQERDKHLADKLQKEWPQILNWMIEGCKLWQQHGLNPGAKILAATEQYLKSNDLLGDWIAERCEITNDDALFDGRALYKDFEAWCDQQGDTPWKRRGWSDAMLAAGFQDDRNKRIRGFRGIRLLSSVSPEQRPDYYDR